MNEPLADVFRHNLWANLRLLEACAGLPEEHLDASVPGTYGAVRDTLQHMLASEARYVMQFTKEEPPDALSEDAPFPGVQRLLESARASGEALVRIAAETAAGAVLHGKYRGQDYEMNATVLLTQAINHATEHRAHVVSTLSTRGIESPRLDALAWWLESGGKLSGTRDA